MTQAATVPELLAAGAPDAVAVQGAGGRDATYAGLRATVDALAGQLRGAGIAPGDRVALVLPNSPGMAAVFLAAATAGTAAPLNPRYREEELSLSFEELGVKVVVATPDAEDIPALPDVRRLHLQGDGLDLTLTENGRPVPSAPGPAPSPADVAMVLQTSGTTSRPKTVPLTHANLAVSAANIAESLVLTAADRCLMVMPLFHIRGLIAGLLAPLSAGGAIACPGDFNAFRFFEWLEAFRPTWYTAVPTMHQLILSRAGRHAETLARTDLRFVRSSSAPLPPVVLERIEETFGAPMIEAYGMTEATHQMAAQPLPPSLRQPGAVGRPTSVARSPSVAPASPPATRPTPMPTPPPSPLPVGSAPATRVTSTRTATSSLPAASRSSSTAVARRSPRARSRRSSSATPPCARPSASPSPTPPLARTWPPPSSETRAPPSTNPPSATSAASTSPPSRSPARSSSSTKSPLAPPASSSASASPSASA